MDILDRLTEIVAEPKKKMVMSHEVYEDEVVIRIKRMPELNGWSITGHTRDRGIHHDVPAKLIGNRGLAAEVAATHLAVWGEAPGGRK